jgi:hypothetical protein
MRTREEVLAYQKEYYAKNKDAISTRRKAEHQIKRIERNARTRELAKQFRKDAIEHYGGNCACCGEATYEFLAIDHTDGNGNKHRKDNKINPGRSTYRWLKMHSYPEGFRVLCHNCNMSRGFYGYCPHEQRKEAQIT